MPRLPTTWLIDTTSTLFRTAGLSAGAAQAVAAALVEADQRGIGSHGLMLVPMYLERIARGSVSLSEQPETIVDRGAVALLDAGHGLGGLTGDAAMALAVGARLSSTTSGW